MQRDGSVVFVPDGIALKIGLAVSSNHVKMKRVTNQFKYPTNKGKLNVLNFLPNFHAIQQVGCYLTKKPIPCLSWVGWRDALIRLLVLGFLILYQRWIPPSKIT